MANKKKAVQVKALTPSQKLDKIGIEAICEQIADGVFYSDLAKSLEVARGTLIKWLEDNHSDLYARAREARADKMAEDILEIADDASRDLIVNKQGDEVPNNELIQRSRLRVDARKWLASKMFPKKYGEKTTLSGDEENPLKVLVQKVELIALK